MIRTLAACLLVLAATFSASSQSCTYNAGFHLVEGRDSTPQPTMARPTAGAWYKDPVYGTCVVRATDFRAEGFSDFARNDYSRRQAFNADNSMYLIYGNRGAWQVYSIATLQRIKELPYLGGDAEPQWHPTNPDLLYFLPTNGGMVIYELTVSTGTRRTVADFTGRLPWPTAVHVWTKSEGSPSADARYWGLMVDDDSWASLGFFTYDMQRDSIVATYATNGRRPDNVSMSPTGQYLVVNWDDGMYAFSRDLSSPYRLSNTGEHSDIALGANGHDIFVSIDYQANDGDVYMYDLATATRTDLFGTYLNGTATAVHFSGKAFARPGWVLMSTYADGGGTVKWLHRKVFAVELAANPRVYHLAHHHVSEYSGDYWDEPHASVNRNFTRMLFNSNWDDGTTAVDAYMIQIPADALPGGASVREQPSHATVARNVRASAAVLTIGARTFAALVTGGSGPQRGHVFGLTGRAIALPPRP